jgi:hypothetical protein
VVEKLIRHTLETAKARNLSSRVRSALEKRHHSLRSLHREFKDSLDRLVNGKGLPGPFDDKRHLLRLFGIAVVKAYFLGSACPAPRIAKSRTTKPTAKTKGRKPKWHLVADTLLPDTLLSKIRNKRPSADKAAERLLSNLNQTLIEKGMRPVSQRTLRDYIGKKVGKQRT